MVVTRHKINVMLRLEKALACLRILKSALSMNSVCSFSTIRSDKPCGFTTANELRVLQSIQFYFTNTWKWLNCCRNYHYIGFFSYRSWLQLWAGRISRSDLCCSRSEQESDWRHLWMTAYEQQYSNSMDFQGEDSAFRLFSCSNKYII